MVGVNRTDRSRPNGNAESPAPRTPSDRLTTNTPPAAPRTIGWLRGRWRAQPPTEKGATDQDAQVREVVLWGSGYLGIWVSKVRHPGRQCAIWRSGGLAA